MAKIVSAQFEKSLDELNDETRGFVEEMQASTGPGEEQARARIEAAARFVFRVLDFTEEVDRRTLSLGTPGLTNYIFQARKDTFALRDSRPKSDAEES